MKLHEVNQSTRSIWIPNRDGDIDVSARGLATLEGAPPYVNGNFYCNLNTLRSLEFAPRTVYGNFVCNHNYITSFHNIHQQIKLIKGRFTFSNQETGTAFPMPSHILGLCFIKFLPSIGSGSRTVNDLFDQYKHDVNLFQEALIDAGFPEQARL